jgi:hypothetical protein
MSMLRARSRARLLAAAVATLLALVAAGPVAAHEERDVGGYQFVVGFIGEPVYVGQKSGLELMVSHNDQPVEGLADSLRAEVINGDARRDLPLSPRFGVPGWYQSYFFPTVAGPYTFHVTGTLPDGSAVDESFTSSPDGFNEVQDAVVGQFPERLPSTAELAASAKQGADAAAMVPIAVGLGVVALVAALAALGLALAGRSRARS